MLATRRAQRLDERRVEHVAERAADRRRRARRRRSSSSARFQRTIRSSASNTTRPSSSDSRMFSLNSRIRPSSSALRCSWRYRRPFSIAVATWPATAVSSARSSLLNGSSVSLRPSASTAIAPSLEDARHEVVDAGVAPEFDFLGHEARRRNRIVERDGVPGVEPRHHRRRARQRAAPAAEAVVADRGEVARPVARRREHQRHPIDDQRLDDARDQPLAEPDDVEVAVQIARERRPARGGSRSGRDRTRGRARSAPRPSPAAPAGRRRASPAARRSSCDRRRRWRSRSR